MPFSFREEFWIFPFLFLFVTPRVGPFLTPGASYEETCRDPLGDATYQISKLYAFQFLRNRILKFSFFVAIFEIVTPRGWISYNPWGII